VGDEGLEAVATSEGKTACHCGRFAESNALPQDVAQIAEKWAKLPKAIKKAILAMVKASS
jgi:hypothetical protein